MKKKWKNACVFKKIQYRKAIENKKEMKQIIPYLFNVYGKSHYEANETTLVFSAHLFCAQFVL